MSSEEDEDEEPTENEDEDPHQRSAVGEELYSEYWGKAEKEHNRNLHGKTYRELYGRDHERCIILCINPGQRTAKRCPVCYGKAGARPMTEVEIEPLMTKGERLAGWFGGVVAAFWESVTYPFRVSQEHRIALVRDVLQDAMEAGLAAELVQVCPTCEAHDAREVAKDE